MSPMAALRYCAQPGCSVLVPRGRCRVHARQRELSRGNTDVRKWYHLARWTHLRLRVLTDQCYQCAACGVVQANLAVDHIQRHDGDPAKFWDRENLQGLCAPCHSRKTTRGE